MSVKRQFDIKERIPMDGSEQEFEMNGDKDESFRFQAAAGDILMKTESGSAGKYYTIFEGGNIGSDDVLIGGQTLYFIGSSPAVLEIIVQKIVTV